MEETELISGFNTLYDRLTIVEKVSAVGEDASKLQAIHAALLETLNQSSGIGNGTTKQIKKAIKKSGKEINKFEEAYKERVDKFYGKTGLSPSDALFPHACFWMNPKDGKYVVSAMPGIDLPEVQRSIMGEYSENPVFRNAADGNQTIEETLNEVREINKGIKKILPRRQNKEHNERVNYLSKLVDCMPDWSLKANGILVPDNLVGGIAYPGLLFGILNFPPESSGEIIGISLFSVFIGGLAQLFGRVLPDGEVSPLDQAKYVDKKIKEIYAPAKSS